MHDKGIIDITQPGKNFYYKNFLLEREIYVYRTNDKLHNAFKEKCEQLNFKRSEVLRTIVYEYIKNDNFIYLKNETEKYLKIAMTKGISKVRYYDLDIDPLDKLDSFRIEIDYRKEFERKVRERTDYQNVGEFIRVLIKTFIAGLIVIDRTKIRDKNRLHAVNECLKVLIHRNFEDYKKII